MKEEEVTPDGFTNTSDIVYISGTWFCEQCQVGWEPEQVEWKPDQIMLTPVAHCPKCKSKLYAVVEW